MMIVFVIDEPFPGAHVEPNTFG